ncbi:hypothetical protein QAD02_004000 [Eretmocerus hayati]|uniref:Uncharacterized protein n=2 Tax=Eretmocerus hayati TaxID=131215 RepID=A0ACC2NPA0_9HYME|nr:hypothetical protein QAD02_003981 [Eretmocerus hayati]KAJ8672740.1 hypothetical protein QAD02_004000 [Eretmocerus hayati]
MYIIKCIEDGDICEIRNDNVFCDHKTVKPGSIVKFRYLNSMYTGKVLTYSDDLELIQETYLLLTQRKVSQNTPEEKGLKGKLIKPSKVPRQVCNRGKDVQYSAIEQIELETQRAEQAIQRQIASLQDTRHAEEDSYDNDELDSYSTNVMNFECDSDSDQPSPAKNKNQANLKRKGYNSSAKRNDSPASKRIRNEANTSSCHSQDNVEKNQSGSSVILRRSSRINNNTKPDERVRKRNSFHENSISSDPDEDELMTRELNYQESPGVLRNEDDGIRTRNRSTRTQTQEVSNNQNRSQLETQLPTGYAPIVHEQLFGENCEGSKMSELGNGIFCKESTVDYALSSTNPRQCCRKLMRGVFTLDAILHCNFSQKNARRPHQCEVPSLCEQCQLRQTRQIEAPDSFKAGVLYGPAVQEIIAFTKRKAEEIKNWPKMSHSNIRRGMSQNVTDIRVAYYAEQKWGKPFKYEIP